MIGEEYECIIVFGVLPIVTDMPLFYEFDVQKEILNIKDSTGYIINVKQNEYKYFIYELDCKSCKLHL